MGLAAFNRMRRLQAESEEQKDEVVSELDLLRIQGKELGIPRASQMGEDKLRAAISEKEAELIAANLAEKEKELLDLRTKAIELGIEGVEDKGIETLTSEIALLEG